MQYECEGFATDMKLEAARYLYEFLVTVEWNRRFLAEEGVLRCASRLKELRELPDNWFDEESASPSPDSLSAAEKLLHYVPYLAQIVSIFPTYEGGIQFEYQHNSWDWSLDFLAHGGVEVHGLEIISDEEFGLKLFSGLNDDLLQLVRRSVDQGGHV